ncbi:hypothetical protein [Kaistia terrae]|uniref:Uncharacterized protein n=1 Tax=Kaistia terrae TaxID=537017 RepID=A0ABW0PWV7_9HYPH|nr:hypothetical protein [Kaistia terrae]MCX5580533.1 hypothetical protein [Kaistia terrae]
MISVEGYSPLTEFYAAAQRSIRLRLQQKRQKLEQDGGWRAVTGHQSNVPIAAKFLVYDLFFRCTTGVAGQGVFMLSADGTRAKLDPRLLEPAEETKEDPREDLNAPKDAPNEAPKEVDASFSKARVEFFGGRWAAAGAGIFGLKSLRSEYWHSAFLTTKVFQPRERRLIPSVRDITRYTPIVDWQTSTISLAELRLFAKSMSLIYEANAGFAALGIEMGSRSFARGVDTRIGSAASILEMMSPYEGRTVMAPSEWIDEFFADLRPQSIEKQARQEDRAPKDMIVELYRSSASMTRDEIKEALFPEMSARQFDRHWKQATDAAPELKRPGRRSAKS